MLRLAAAISFVVGVLLLIAGIMKIAPSGTVQLAMSLMFFGAVLGGLSFVRKPDADAAAEPPLSPVERVTGMFYQPARVFQNLRAHPNWLAAFLVIVLLNLIYNFAFVQRLTPQRIASFTADKVIESGFIPEEAQAGFREQQLESLTTPVGRASGIVSQIVWGFIGYAFLAAIMLLGVLMFGGRINFWQSLCVALYAYLPIAVVGKLLSLILLYVKSVDDIHPIRGQGGLVQDNLGVLFSPAEHPVLFAAASLIGVLVFVWVWLMATGLRNAGERVGNSAAWSVAIALWVLGLAFSVISATLFGNFIS
ncbi:MAG: YIP1 family protein [Pyrinomonadaceae bacterium]|nr:YIP1 family protein [Pyrinomonadaceae bacterium]